ncbi:MAG: hypothetical protein RLZZ528_1911 [Pseudomonadota bacterium]
MPETPPPRCEVLRRTLGAGVVQGLRCLETVAWDDGATRHLRAFFGTGTAPLDLSAPARVDCASVTELRAISGGVMVAGTLPRVGAARLALPGGEADLAPAAPEWELFRGRNVLLGFRLAETPQTVAAWLDYHARHHDTDAALVIDRAETGHDAFAATLSAELDRRGVSVRVVLLDSPLPLGKPGMGPETHPFLAPDAPGKDRMEQPAPDPWLAPLGEGLVHEIAKWRFLAAARAVLTLDVCDILAPRGDQPAAFDLCRMADKGVILMAGRRIYPWRIREGQAEAFGDHICRQFDARRGIARWGVAPDLAGLENTWRAIRVAFAKPDPGQVVPFWRAMGLRVPGRKASELAPKTSLIEDPALLDLSTAVFGHRPVRPPVSQPKPAAADPAGTGRTCIVTTMKNEGPFILEWLAYHRAIGVDDFLIYTNDCTDGTDTMLDLLQAKGLVQHRDNPFRSMDMPPQHAALQSAESEPLIRDCGWAICMDVDEFINVKAGDGTLGALYAAMEAALPGANMIALTWRLFGNSHVHAYEDRFLIEQFTLAAPEIVRKPHQAWGFKTLFRNIDIYKKLGVHRPKGLRPDLWDQVRWLNGSGKRMPREMFRNGWRSTSDTYGYDLVSLNHYAVRSAESFLVKRDRGRVNHVDRDQGMNYWFRMNFNMVEDRSIQRMIPLARAEYDRLLSDPEIRAAHDAAVAAHRAKIAELKARPDQAAFYAELTGERMESLSRILHVFGSSVFNAGPKVIPPDLHKAALPPDFYFTVEHEGDAEH